MTAQAPGVLSLAASWCQGLTGIATTLLHASDALDDPDLAAVAREAADACITHLPHIDALGQCCGLSGVGNLLIDLALRDKDERYWSAAADVASHMLARSAGTPEHPLLIDGTRAYERPASWSSGLAGMLTFFHRLAEGEHPPGAGPAGHPFRRECRTVDPNGC